MPVGNEAVFFGNVAEGGEVDWTTEFASVGEGGSYPKSCSFEVSGGQTSSDVAVALATSFESENPGGTFNASAAGNKVKFTARDYTVSGMMVGSDSTPVSTNPSDPTSVGSTGVSVFEPVN